MFDTIILINLQKCNYMNITYHTVIIQQIKKLLLEFHNSSFHNRCFIQQNSHEILAIQYEIPRNFLHC